VISKNRSGVISAGPFSTGLFSRATDTGLLSQILEVLADEVLLVLRDQLPVDLALGCRAVLGEIVGVGNQLGVGPAARAAGGALRGAAAGALAGDVDLLGGGGGLAAAGARPAAAATARAGVLALSLAGAGAAGAGVAIGFAAVGFFIRRSANVSSIARSIGMCAAPLALSIHP